MQQLVSVQTFVTGSTYRVPTDSVDKCVPFSRLASGVYIRKEPIELRIAALALYAGTPWHPEY